MKSNTNLGTNTVPQSFMIVKILLLFVFLAAMIAILLSNGCGASKQSPTELTAPFTLIGSLDTSASDRHTLPSALLGMVDVMTNLPDGAFVTLYRADSSCKEIYNGVAPASSEEVVQELTPRLSPVSTTDNTYLDVLAGQITRRLNTVTGLAVVIIDTDYYGEGMSRAGHTGLAAHVAMWGQDRHVVGIVVCHVNPERMAAVRSDFAAAGKKLTVTPDGLDPDLVRNLVNKEAGR